MADFPKNACTPKYEIGQKLFRLYYDDVQDFIISGIRVAKNGSVFYTSDVKEEYESAGNWVGESKLFESKGHVLEYFAKKIA